jgi:hypothetical protein
MTTPDRKTVEADVKETLVEAARRFMALHPDVDAVGLTIVSRTIDPRAVSTTMVGSGGAVLPPDIWSLATRRFVEAAEYCLGNVRELMLDELAGNIARDVERLREERRRMQPSRGDGTEDDHGGR